MKVTFYALCEGDECPVSPYMVEVELADAELGSTLQVAELGPAEDVPQVCPQCGQALLNLFASWPRDDSVAWLIGQRTDVRTAYLSLREDGMDDETAREMAVVAHTPPPTD